MHLSDIAGDLTAEMETTLTGQGRTGPDRVGSRSSVIPLPFDPQASAVVTDVHAKLVGWCLLLRDEAGADLPADTVQAMASHALGWLDWLAKHPAVEELVAEVAEMVRMAVPAPAGVSPRSSSWRTATTSRPRACGGEPSLCVVLRNE